MIYMLSQRSKSKCFNNFRTTLVFDKHQYWFDIHLLTVFLNKLNDHHKRICNIIILTIVVKLGSTFHQSCFEFLSSLTLCIWKEWRFCLIWYSMLRLLDLVELNSMDCKNSHASVQQSLLIQYITQYNIINYNSFNGTLKCIWYINKTHSQTAFTVVLQ